MENIVDIVVQIVAAAGTAKSSFVETMHVLLKEKDKENARTLYEEGRRMFQQAHEKHLEILAAFAENQKLEADVLLIHGECQLMSAEDFMILSGQLLDYADEEGKGEKARLL